MNMAIRVYIPSTQYNRILTAYIDTTQYTSYASNFGLSAFGITGFGG